MPAARAAYQRDRAGRHTERLRECSHARLVGGAFDGALSDAQDELVTFA